MDGTFELRDTTDAVPLALGQAPVEGALTCAEIAPSGEAVFLGDEGGTVHVHVTRGDYTLSSVEVEAEVDPAPPSIRPPADWNSPLSALAAADKSTWTAAGTPLLSRWNGAASVLQPFPPEPLPDWLFTARSLQKGFVQAAVILIC